MANLLIIDDDASAAGALATLLRRRGHAVACATTAGDGLRHLRASRPDLVLLDLGLPQIDGMELLDAVAEDPACEDVRITVFTGRDDPQTQQAAARMGACDYILKGLDWDQTCRRIESCLSTGD